jgi:hypothetical protein
MRGPANVASKSGICPTVQQGIEDVEGSGPMERGISILTFAVHVRTFLVQQPGGQRQALSPGGQVTGGHGQGRASAPVPVVHTSRIGLHPPPQLCLIHEQKLDRSRRCHPSSFSATPLLLSVMEACVVCVCVCLCGSVSVECGETWRADQASKSLRPDLPFYLTCRASGFWPGRLFPAVPRTSCLAYCSQALAVPVAWQCGRSRRREKEIRLALPQFWLLLSSWVRKAAAAPPSWSRQKPPASAVMPFAVLC